MHPTIGRAIAVIIFCASLWPIVGSASDLQCMSAFAGAGHRKTTPAEVTGAPQERLTLLGHHPEDGDEYRTKLPDGGYVLTGDKVDLLATCDGYDYVRFHGVKRVSVGWVQASRIKAIGAAYVPLPANAAAICRAAEETLNHGGQLQRMDTTAMEPSVVQALNLEVGWNASPPQVARMTVDGRSLAATSIDSGGTCHSSTVIVLSGDLKARLSPADRDDRDIENNGANSWGFGVSEDLVVVLGLPMVLSSGEGSSSFHLSAIDKDGDIVPVCEGGPVTLDKRQLVTSSDDKVCHAILNGQQTPIALNPPAPNQSISLGQRPDDFKVPAGQTSGSTYAQLRFHDDARAADVEYTLKETGQADLENTGKVRSVGLVTFFEGNSTAGCGTFHDSQVVPLYLNEQGQADPSNAVNEGLIRELPHDMEEGRLVSYLGKTYIELSPGQGGPSSEVWIVDAKGPKQVCSFQLTHMVVRPI